MENGVTPPLPLIEGTLPTGIRYRVENPDGSVSTVRTISIGVDEGEVLIPTVIGDRVVTDDEAIEHFYQTGEHFGIFPTPDEATRYADWLHNQHQAEMQRTPIDKILAGGR